MPLSGTLTFAPVLHNITPERVVFVYNTLKDGSFEVAQYYQQARQIPDNHIIAISIAPPASRTRSSEREYLITLDEYTEYIANPIWSAIQTLNGSSSSAGVDSGISGGIWVIILGYGIPLAFEDNDGEIIAVSSHLHRLGKGFNDSKSPNHTYDRRANFQYFDEEDATRLFITAVLDGPTAESVKTLIDRSLDVDNQTFIAGQIVVDPYGLKQTDAQLRYQMELEEFTQWEIPYLGLLSTVTVDIEDPYQDPTIKSLERESFYWGWNVDQYSKDLFLSQNERRCFLYNADSRSAASIHFYDTIRNSAFDVDGSDPWCNLAVNVPDGYAACAGSVDDVGDDAYLSPRPFFESLHHGASLGEAFLFASRYLDWKTILIGDPLMVVNFPIDSPNHQNPDFVLLPNNEVIQRIKRSLEEALGWSIRQEKALNTVVEYVTSGKILTETLKLLHPTSSWRSIKNRSAQESIFYNIVLSWLTYMQQTTQMTLTEWLSSTTSGISERLNEVVATTGHQKADNELVHLAGYWDYTIRYTHDYLTLENVHFLLDIATDDTFDNVIVSLSTLTSVTNWQYEREPFEFFDFPENGFPSNFSRRRIKYIAASHNYLSTGEIYYVRWRATQDNGTPLNNYEYSSFVCWA